MAFTGVTNAACGPQPQHTTGLQHEVLQLQHTAQIFFVSPGLRYLVERTVFAASCAPVKKTFGENVKKLGRSFKL